jgi:hypothetical protein
MVWRETPKYLSASVQETSEHVCRAVFAGFYVANTLTLTFGVLGINDVVAGAFSVAFAEVVTRAYYRKSPVPGLGWDFLNWFKLG